MSLLEIIGKPVPPPGKTFHSSTPTTLDVQFQESYSEGEGSEEAQRYPTEYKLQYDASDDSWKPYGATAGVAAQIPGAQAGEPVPPIARFTQRNTYADGTTDRFSWRLRPLGQENEWRYSQIEEPVSFVTSIPGQIINTAWVDVKRQYNAVADGAADDSAVILLAIAAATTTGADLYFQPGAYRISDSVTIPQDVDARFDPGAYFVIDGGETLTIQGGIKSSRQQIFVGDGTVAFTGNYRLREVFPEWWGAIPNTSLNCTSPLNKCFLATAEMRLTVLLGVGVYMFGTSGTHDDPEITGNPTYGLRVWTGNRIVGAGMGRTIFRLADGEDTQRLFDGFEASDVECFGFSIDGNKANNGPSHYGFIFNGSVRVNVEYCEVYNIKGTASPSTGAIDFGGHSVRNEYVRIVGCYLHDIGSTGLDQGDGIYFKGSYALIHGNNVQATDATIGWETGSTDPDNPNTNVIISDNIILNNGDAVDGNGLAIAVSARRTGSLQNVYMDGGVISGNIIEGAYFSNGGGVMIYSDDDGNVMKNITITGNTIRRTVNGNAIHAERLSDSLIANNAISDTSTEFDKSGISCLSCTRIVVQGNNVRSAGAYGIIFQGVVDSSILGNFVSDAGRNANPASAGVAIADRSGDASTGILVMGNNITDNVAYGLSISGGAVAMLSDNYIVGNGTNYHDTTTSPAGSIRELGNVHGTAIDSPAFFDNIAIRGTVYVADYISFLQGVSGAPYMRVSNGRLKIAGGSDSLNTGLNVAGSGGIAFISQDGTRTLGHFRDDTGLLSLMAGGGINLGLTGNPGKLREVGNVTRLVGGTSGLQLSNQAETLTFLSIPDDGLSWTWKDGMLWNIGTVTGLTIGANVNSKWAFGGAAPTGRQDVTGSRGGNAALASLITALATKGIIADLTT